VNELPAQLLIISLRGPFTTNPHQPLPTAMAFKRTPSEERRVNQLLCSSPFPEEGMDPLAIYVWACGCITDSEGQHLSFDASSDMAKKVTTFEVNCHNHMEKIELNRDPQDIYLWECDCTFDQDGHAITFDPAVDGLKRVRIVKLICNKHHGKSDSAFYSNSLWSSKSHAALEEQLQNMEIEPGSPPQVEHGSAGTDLPGPLAMSPSDVSLAQRLEAELRPMDSLRNATSEPHRAHKDSLFNKPVSPKQNGGSNGQSNKADKTPTKGSSSPHSRRARACDLCRKRKIRCEVVEGQAICAACAAHNQECTYLEGPQQSRKNSDAN
jgi:hypothetical protein